ncbi:MAG TPA: helix-turn-helix domain-containing protein [Noviherbaspirillum sp.]|nr:helix-turn-helix domain-containing protein [Noviherbaspirillum sp.]
MSRQVVLPRLELRPYVRNFMMSDFASLDVHLPASIDVQIVVYLRGQGFLLEDKTFDRKIPTAFFAGPSLFPRRFRVEPGSRFIAATFRPSGFFSCFGIPVSVLNEQLVPLDCIVRSHEAASLLDELYQNKNDELLIHALEKFLLQSIFANRNEEAYLPVLSLERLLMPATEIARAMDISTRQLERRFLIRYGVSLRDYRRISRFSAALAGLMHGGAQYGSLAQTAVDAQYVDQSHFTKDFRQFVGATPGHFLKARRESDSIYHLWQLNPEELQSYRD